MTPAAIAAVIGIVVAPLLTYLAASRRLSGRIGTSDADRLWKESSDIRDDYRSQLTEANKRVVAIEGRMAQLERNNGELAKENLDIKTKHADCERRCDEMQRRIELQEKIIEELRGQIEQLQHREGRK